MKYKCSFDFKVVDLFLLIGGCIGFYIIPIVIFSYMAVIFSEIFKFPLFDSAIIFALLGIAIGSMGSLIFIAKYIIEGIEIYSVDNK